MSTYTVAFVFSLVSFGLGFVAARATAEKSAPMVIKEKADTQASEDGRTKALVKEQSRQLALICSKLSLKLEEAGKRLPSPFTKAHAAGIADDWTHEAATLEDWQEKAGDHHPLRAAAFGLATALKISGESWKDSHYMGFEANAPRFMKDDFAKYARQSRDVFEMANAE